MRRTFWLAFLVSAACAANRPARQTPEKPAPPPPSSPLETSGPRPAQFLPTTVYSGGDGSSIEQAVVVMAGSEQEGVRRENEWIFARYGKFRKTGVGLETVEQRKYDVIRAELADHSEKEIFFDITSFFGKSESK